MSTKPGEIYISPEEYPDMEEKSLERHEYFNGEIFQMPGASLYHVMIAGNIAAQLHRQLNNRDCRVLQTDMRVLIEKTGLYIYPDIVIVCGKSQLKIYKGLETLLNPILIVEVLSPSTENCDKGIKFEHYRSIETLKEYLTVSQDKKRITRHLKSDDGSWNLVDFVGEEVEIVLNSIDCSLTFIDIYDKVEFEE